MEYPNNSVKEIIMIEIMNLRYDKPSQPWDVKVDRSSVLGNPFPMKGEAQRNAVCEKYAQHLGKEIISDGPIRKEMIRLYYIYKQYKRLRLFCWCAPKRCHAETIKAWIETEKS